MKGGLRDYVTKLSQMDAERLAGHDCMFARRLEDLRKFQAEVEPAIAEAMTAAFERGARAQEARAQQQPCERRRQASGEGCGQSAQTD